MRFIAECLRRIHYFINRRRLERELQQEMEAHREMMDEPARFGNTLRLREESRDAWGLTWLDDLSKDLKYGVRQLVKARAFTILSLATLAMGIGASSIRSSLRNLRSVIPNSCGRSNGPSSNPGSNGLVGPTMRIRSINRWAPGLCHSPTFCA